MATKAEVVTRIEDLLIALAELDDGRDAERDYLVAACPARLERAIRGLPTVAIHVLAAIGEGVTNIVGLSERTGQLKGTVSKHVQRLVEAGLVQRSPVPGNRKEVHLTLTDDGALLDQVHRKMHTEKSDALRGFLVRYSSADLQTLATVLDDLVSSGLSVWRPVTGKGR
ncbi:MarR family winged helix-turn-helix transcriptional regulator [Mycolicibacterium sp. 018/SC-01/001]|uniref:MarR family winged helix-turn-helix transcriptional regulator n=1 Tax=Mycolicibacterium sp. 018/SC-01/001 TaxID=2592069 RepID=UPI00163DC13F|nr:MarR family transcriptional regulator [Mycolicibacterium sp. 018/SC-01/001]